MHSDFLIIRPSVNLMVAAAYIDCQKFHDGQVRKYTGEPYWVHPREVVEILIRCGIEDPEMLAAAFGHDWYEDTDASPDYVRSQYGDRVHTLIDELTERKLEGNRRERKLAEAYRLSHVSPDAQTIKCADLISNTSDITAHDPDFAKVYLLEKRHVLANLTEADLVVHAWAYRSLEQAAKALGTRL